MKNTRAILFQNFSSKLEFEKTVEFVKNVGDKGNRTLTVESVGSVCQVDHFVCLELGTYELTLCIALIILCRAVTILLQAVTSSLVTSL